ncbi:histidine kinase-like protein [Streptomyces sp. TLI_235]|nr:ATP-binding protein [Streptomyces sp. TLI_235]PBC69626.1 histidine kinase-like protein [Streptomyces sp. TLI_235]
MFIPSTECNQDQRAAGTAQLLPTTQEAPTRSVPTPQSDTSDGHQYSFAVPPRDLSIRVARNEVIATLNGWGMGDRDVVDSIRVIVSELVTNAVRYASQVTSLISVTMLIDEMGGFRIGVWDGNGERPYIEPVPADATSGRGMHIIQNLLCESGGYCSTECHREGGKTVWVTIPRVLP